MMRKTLLTITLLGALMAALLGAAPAPASPSQVSIMMDDDQLIYGTFAQQQHTLAQMKSLGVQFVRVTVLWRNVAAGARGHKHFDPSNPATYPHHNWDPYDDLVLTAPSYGISVYFDVTGPGPSWAMGTPPARERRSRATWMPNATQFYNFAYAVGKRYSGTYRKEIGTHQLLPRVRLWSIWNEPNQGGWLTPQSYYSPIAHQVIPYSPILYRELYFQGQRALYASGHRQDAILMGETAPMGRGPASTRNPLAPKQFVRELLCVSPQGVPYTGAQAQARNCSMFSSMGPLITNGYAHHPYTLKVAPTVAPQGSDDVTISNLGDLGTLLDQLAVTTGNIPQGLPIFSTEFGYETNPPDPFHGIPLSEQAQWNSLGDFIAFNDPRVAGVTQFLLRDAKPARNHTKGSKAYWDTYQSGLLNASGHQKPAYAGYMLPLVPFLGGTDPATGKRYLGVWGQLRFLAHPAKPLTPATEQVQLQFEPQGQTAWQPLGAPVSVINGQQFFGAAIDTPGPGMIRAQWKAHMAPYLVNSVPVAVPTS